MQPIINHYSNYIRHKFGERIQKITVHGTNTCPNRDGTKGNSGCTFCNNATFSAPAKLVGKSISDQVQHGIDQSKFRYKNVNKYIIYFQSYSNTYGDSNNILKMFDEALSHPQVIGLSIGTRPDCLNKEILEYLSNKAQTYEITLELGLESFSDDTLSKINRGHDSQCFKDAVFECERLNIPVCAHLIIGFPWETKEQILISAKNLSLLPIKFLKLHQLHVVKDTQMADEYLNSPFKVLSKQEYLEQVVLLLTNIRHDIIIQRLIGDASKEYLIAPLWPLEVANIAQEVENLMSSQNLFQGCKLI